VGAPTFTYGYGDNPPIDYPRFLVADTVEFAADGVTPVYIFADEEIAMAGVIDAITVIAPGGGGQQSYTGMSTPRFQAAALLEALASNKARLASAMKVLDISIDTTKAAAALCEQAEALRNAERNSGAFAIVEWVPDQFAARERLWKQMVRLLN
jgi:hypothetical protein